MTKVTLTIDGKQVQAEAGTTVLEAAKTAGIEVPHYCYHPGLSIAGNCRMCLVEVEKMPKPMIGCATTVGEGMVVHTDTEKVKKMRQSVMEFLLINHPLDCPTCDQAGECRLQDYYMDYDQIPSRFQENKVEKDKMVDLGANVMLDQERCIACTRCIRLCREVGGKDELALAYRGDHVTITTFPGQQLSNNYAGNVVDVCPVGALTSKDFRFKKRSWFLSKTKSICTGCSRGCNTELHHEGGKVYRMLPRQNDEVNKYWICDEGRYGYKFINDQRVLRNYVNNGSLSEVSFEEALLQIRAKLKDLSADEAIVVGHLSQSNEVLASLKAFAKDVLKSHQLFYSERSLENAISDNFLMTSDKNANRKGAEELGYSPLSRVSSGGLALVVGGLSDAEARFLESKGVKIIGLWLVNEAASMQKAQVILPLASVAEQKGTFTNLDGRVQGFEKAFDIKGEARLLGDYLETLKNLFNL